MKAYSELTDNAKINAVKNHCLLFCLDYNDIDIRKWVLTSPHFHNDKKLFTINGEFVNWKNPNQFK